MPSPSFSFSTFCSYSNLHRRRVRRLAKGITSQTTPRQEGGLTEQRNQLRTRIRVWERLLLLYIPGLLQYQADLRTQDNEFCNTSEHPEDNDLWLPSRLPLNVRGKICIPNLPEIEEKLRTAQCYDALDSLRHTLKIKSRLVKFKNKNIRGQREGLRSRAVIDRVHDRARVAAEKYRHARAAKLRLSGPGEWEIDLKVLDDADIRGYQDPNQLRTRVGRRGTLEDHQVDDVSAVDSQAETNNFSLFGEERTRRDGTGETRRTLSWIWLTNSKTPDVNAEADDILRVEWAKSRARAHRAKEEVLLLREEMRRVLEYLEWKAKWWTLQAGLRSVDTGLSEGLHSYAEVQSQLQHSLVNHFRSIWKQPLANVQQAMLLDKRVAYQDELKDEEDVLDSDEDEIDNDEDGLHDEPELFEVDGVDDHPDNF